MRQNRGFQYQNREPQRHNLVNNNQNRNQRISNAAHQNPNKIPVKTVANYLMITDEVKEQAHVYAALDPSGRNRQYSILEAQGDYQGKSLTFLIDSGSSHSFISPSTLKHLHLEPRLTGKKLQVSLASGSIVSCEEQIVELLFQLEGHSTSQSLKVLKMGKFQGILGMDWLSKNKADIHCSQGTVSFYSLNGEQVYIHGRRGNVPLRVVKAKQLIKGLRKGEDLDNANKLEEWIISMEDYFDLAEYNFVAKGIMGRAKIKGSAKIWWKLNCKSRGVLEISQSWEELQLRLRERYSPPNYLTTKMNEFLACVWRGRTIDTYYEDFIKLSRHAPLITEEQKLSRFILGLEGKLADEVEALRPTSLADALIRAKPNLSSFLKSNNQQGEQKREQPYHFESSHRPHKFQNMARPVNRSEVQHVRVNALPITQGGRPMYCFECGQEGHKRMHCPQMRQNRGFQYQNRGPQRHNLVNSNQNQNQRISNAAHQNPNKIPVKMVANYLTITDEVTEQAHVYAALDPSGRNRQYSILEAQGDYQDKSLTFLIDSGSSHSFIFPSTVKHLHLEPRSTGKRLQVSLLAGRLCHVKSRL
ncbi:hypothetical protein L7F22_035713 [Adiantum nelumboides]|nr:hypothetical protein [Adiantum nelumboides]